MKKNKNHCQKQPFNINISFNIHPKHVLQNQNSSNNKVTNSAIHPSQPSPANTRYPHRYTTSNHLSQAKSSHPSSNKATSKTIDVSELGQRQLDKLKKNFLKKINNIDIHLPTQTIQVQPQVREQHSGQSSLISAKMEEFSKNNNATSVAHQPHAYHLDLHHFQEAKSKVLPAQEFSKVLGPHTIRKNRTDKKYGLSQNKAVSKCHSQEKWHSCLTEGKIHSHRQTTKKKRKQKSQTLKDKLQKFKVDMSKLVNFYEQNELIKTKMSSQYYNIRSRQVSKDNFYQVSEGQEHQKAHQMRHYQQNISATDTYKMPDVSQKFKQFKQMYQHMKNKSADYDSQSEKEETENIISYYKNISTKLNVPNEKVQIIDCISQGTQRINKPDDKTLKSHIDQLESLQKIEEQSEKGNQALLLNNFVQFVQQTYKGNDNIKNTFQTLLSEFLHKKKVNKEVKQPQQQLPQEQFDIKKYDGFGEQVDEKINKELLSIRDLSYNIAGSYPLQPEELEELERWEKCYNEELLNMKGKMWKEYRTIRNEVQNRIASGSNFKPIATRKSKKAMKIMKCLSEKILRINVESMQPGESVWKKSTYQQSSGALEDKKSISQGDSFDEDMNENSEHSVFSSEQIEDDDENYASGRVIFHQTQQPSQRKDIYIEDDRSIKSQESVAPFSLKHLSMDDKQDIFQFIFLDLTIELYQDYVEKKQGEKHSKEKIEDSGSQRILNSLKKYMDEEKKRVANQPVKKIGISTNINTIRTFLSQIKAYFLQACDCESRKQKLLAKLNYPLGPTNKEMLKSLRMPVLQDSKTMDVIDQDYDQSDLLVLQPDWFIQFENDVICIQKLQLCKYYDDEERDKQRINFLRNCTHIHHKAIFDALNQNLDYCRVFGIWGEPFAWKKKAFFNHVIKQDQIESAINKSGAEVLRASTFACGLMVSKQQSLLKDLADNEPYVRRLQDQRIYKFLEDYVIDLQEKWFFHDDEEAQTLMELSHLIWTSVVKEVIYDLSTIQAK